MALLASYLVLLSLSVLAATLVGGRRGRPHARPTPLCFAEPAEASAPTAVSVSARLPGLELWSWGMPARMARYDRVALASFVAVMDLSMLRLGPAPAPAAAADAVDGVDWREAPRIAHEPASGCDLLIRLDHDDVLPALAALHAHEPAGFEPSHLWGSPAHDGWFV